MIKDRKVNLYGSLQIQKNLQNPVVKAGASIWMDNIAIHHRLRLVPDNKNTVNVGSSHRAEITRGKFKIDSYKVINWCNFSLISNAIQVRFKQNEENEFYARGINESVRDLKKFNFANPDNLLTNFFFNFTRKINSDTRSALEVTLF